MAGPRKINQSFDLSSLTPEHLPEATLGKLPALQELRDALYCPEFRNWVRDVTGCGPLSQKKVDGSVSRYTKGFVLAALPQLPRLLFNRASVKLTKLMCWLNRCRCHLLLHDDVISTRRISWILYLPSANWQANPTWGGALELYPATNPSTPTSTTTTTDSSSSSEPTKPKTWRDEVGSDVIPGKTIHPKWGQFVFFEVQPGKSYHSVEEVVVGEGKERLSISGWFHKPMEGEEGYKGEEEDEDLSSLKQIVRQSFLLHGFQQSSS
jgi:Rps23 Pro-64 3,4-dihydroxylase Tpa1-like proline 4-hydroxylase